MTMLMQPHGDNAGLAAALRGATSTVVAATVSGLFALFVQHSALLWGLSLFMVSLASMALLFRWLDKYPDTL